MIERSPVQRALVRNAKLGDLHASVDEFLPLQEAGVLYEALDLLRGLPLGIDEERKAERIAHHDYLFAVLGIAYSRYRMDAFIELMRGQAAEKIYLVFACCRDEQIGGFYSGFLQHVHSGAVAVNGHDIIKRDAGFERPFIRIYYGKIVPFGGELTGKRGTYLSVSCDDDFHTDPS